MTCRQPSPLLKLIYRLCCGTHPDHLSPVFINAYLSQMTLGMLDEFSPLEILEAFTLLFPHFTKTQMVMGFFIIKEVIAWDDDFNLPSNDGFHQALNDLLSTHG